MKCLAFSSQKAGAVLALPVGARFQTRRVLNPQPVEDAERRVGHIGPELGGNPLEFRTWLDRSAEGKGACELDYNAQVWRPRYLPDDVCFVGVPHWRGKDLCADLVFVWDEWNCALRWSDGVAWRQMSVAQRGARRMAGRYLPGWAATAWCRILSAGPPEHVQDITEEDAEAELVTPRPCDLPEKHVTLHFNEQGNIDPKGKKTMVIGAHRLAFADLWQSIHGAGSWKRNDWVWPIEAVRVARPEDQPSA